MGLWLNSGLTAFADNQSDGSKSHIERYHRYDFDTKEETIFYKGIMPSEKVLDFPVDCNTLTGSVNL